MKTLACIALLLALAPALASAQKTVYVAYDGALLYADADYLADVVDTLAIGDSASLVARDKRFAQIERDGRRGWVLLANISDRAPRIKRGARDSSRTSATSNDTALSKPATPSAEVKTARRSSGGGEPRESGTVQCAGTTKAGRQCSRKSVEGSAYCWQHGTR